VSEAGEAGTTYDPAELRRCIALCFSTSELRALAEELGATGLGGYDRGVSEAAREVVRHFERQGALGRLVARLKEVKPLMEWPEPMPVAPGYQPPPAPPLAPLPAALPVLDAPAPPPAATVQEPVLPAPAPSALPLPLPDPNPPVPPPRVDPQPAPTAPAPMIRDPYAGPAWPGMAPQAARPGRAVDGRALILLGVGVGIVVLVASVAAFLIGRSGSTETAAAPSGSASAQPTTKGPARPMRERGAARMAADNVARSLSNLARECDLPLAPGEEPGADLFQLAYQQCGSRPTIGRPPSGPPPSFTGQGSPRGDNPGARDDAAPAEPAPRPQRANDAPRAPRAPAAAPATKAPANDGSACVGKCAAAQRSCNNSCGPEPTLSSQYSTWQGCQSQCLAQASKCRLGCQ
jgi:hypothetical protein